MYPAEEVKAVAISTQYDESQQQQEELGKKVVFSVLLYVVITSIILH